MPTELDTPPSAPKETLPALSTVSPGDWIGGRIIDVAQIPIKDFETGQIARSPKGYEKHQRQIVIIVDSCGGDTVKARANSEDMPPPIGELAAIYTGNDGLILPETPHGSWQPDDSPYVEAIAKLGRPINVGDNIRWECVREEPTSRGYARKIRAYTITTNDNPQLVAQAEELHLARKQPIPVAAEDADGWAPGEEPF